MAADREDTQAIIHVTKLSSNFRVMCGITGSALQHVQTHAGPRLYMGERKREKRGREGRRGREGGRERGREEG